MAYRNCLEGYLTPGCSTCPDWADGSDNRGIGCATRYPIDWCPHFAKVMEEDSRKFRVCKNCGCRDMESKICSIKKAPVPKRGTCLDFIVKF